jgi:nicotinamidase-related amidase
MAIRKKNRRRIGLEGSPVKETFCYICSAWFVVFEREQGVASKNPLLTELIKAEDSILIIIDLQDSFLEKLAVPERRALSSRIAWLVHVAGALSIPVVVTAEDIPQMGGVSDALSAQLPSDTPVYNKMVFGLADNPEILQAVERTGRRTAILTGLETDVCVAHSAIGLLGLGYQVAVVADAVGSPGKAHANGLMRMQSAGVLLTHVRTLYYEWVRTVKGAEALHKRIERNEVFPEGITF